MTTAVKGLRADWTVTINGVDVSARVQAGGTIDHGRPTVFSDFQAPRAVFDVLTYSMPPGVTVGDPVVIHVTVNGTTQHRRFTGKVQALDVGYMTTRVTAVHAIADLAYVTSGETAEWYNGIPNGLPYVTAPDIPFNGAIGRVAELVARASSDVTVNIVGTQGRYVRERETGLPPEPLLDLLLALAYDCDATLMGTRLGDIDYRARVWNRPARYTLPPGVVQADTIDMALERGLIVNTVEVSYGQPDPTSGLQRYVTVMNTPSVIKHGERREQLYTQLANRAGAEGHGGDYLVYRDELWHAPDVTLVMSLATVAQVNAIVGLDDGYPVRVAPLPAGYPISQLDTDVIGVTDIMHEQDWRIILHLAPGKPAGDEDDGNYVPDGAITGGDETGTYVKNGHVWRWHKFLNSGQLVAADGVEVVGRMLAVAGGGAGGYAVTRRGGGGGGGGVWEGSWVIKAGSTPVTVGAGGVSTNTVPGASGQPTVVGPLTVNGGGGGGAQVAGNGRDGGSGGGPGGQAVPGTGGDPTGFHGGNAVNLDGGGASGSSRAGWPSDITGAVVEYGPGGETGPLDAGAAVNGVDGLGGGGEGGGPGGAGSGGKGAAVFAYRIEGTAPTGTPYNDPATTYDDTTTPYLGG